MRGSLCCPLTVNVLNLRDVWRKFKMQFQCVCSPLLDLSGSQNSLAASLFLEEASGGLEGLNNCLCAAAASSNSTQSGPLHFFFGPLRGHTGK